MKRGGGGGGGGCSSGERQAAGSIPPKNPALVLAMANCVGAELRSCAATGWRSAPGRAQGMPAARTPQAAGESRAARA